MNKLQNMPGSHNNTLEEGKRERKEGRQAGRQIHIHLGVELQSR